MTQQLPLRVGEKNQLRPHGEVARWESDAPRIVTVTDEDIVSGRPGGLLTACAAGRAWVRAFGFDGACLLEVEVAVAGAAIITLAVGATAPPDTLPRGGRWTSQPPRIVELAAAGELCGLAPGIALLRQEETGSEWQIRVTGARELGVNQQLALADFFALPVQSWRAGSRDAADIDNQGVVTAGDRPRTVPIFATLPDGSEFSFDLRIVRAAAPAVVSPPAAAIPALPPMRAPMPIPEAPPAPAPAPASQRQEVEAHLTRAAELLRQEQWQQAGSELLAADLAATGDDSLRTRVRSQRERMRLQVLEGAAAACAAASAALRHGEFARVRDWLRALRIPTEQSALPAHLHALADTLEALQRDTAENEVYLAQLPARLEAAWRAAHAAQMPGVLAELAAIAVAQGVDELTPTLVSELSQPQAASYPAPLRAALENALADLGDTALTEVLQRLAQTASQDPAGQWLLPLLAPLQPGKRASLVTQLYRQLPPPAQARLVEWLSLLAAQSYGVVLDLMAGVLRKLPPDLALVKALRARLGVAPLEQAAVRWAAGGHQGAQEVLMRLYDYPASTFTKR